MLLGVRGGERCIESLAPKINFKINMKLNFRIFWINWLFIKIVYFCKKIKWQKTFIITL